MHPEGVLGSEYKARTVSFNLQLAFLKVNNYLYMRKIVCTVIENGLEGAATRALSPQILLFELQNRKGTGRG